MKSRAILTALLRREIFQRAAAARHRLVFRLGTIIDPELLDHARASNNPARARPERILTIGASARRKEKKKRRYRENNGEKKIPTCAKWRCVA